MGDVIQAVGPHKDQHGERCEVMHLNQGIAFGFDSDGDPAWWRCCDGSWQGASDVYRLHIVGSWIDPKSFRISDHGPGIYLTRDGREATVTGRGRGVSFPWEGHINNKNQFGKSWKDCGTWQSGERPEDLVRYLRPLPQPQPQFKVGDRVRVNCEFYRSTMWNMATGPVEQVRESVTREGWSYAVVTDAGYGEFLERELELLPVPQPEPEWTPTNELRWKKRTNYAADNMLQQRWTNGTESEWRPVEVKDGV